MAEQLAAKKAAINKGVEIDESKLDSGAPPPKAAAPLPMDMFAEMAL